MRFTFISSPQRVSSRTVFNLSTQGSLAPKHHMPGPYSVHGDLKKTWTIDAWANGKTIDKKDAYERVVRVLKSFGLKTKDIDNESLQMAIEALPYLSTTPSIIAAVQYMNKLHAGPSASEAAQKNIPRTPVRGDSCWKMSELSHFCLIYLIY